MLLGCLKVIAFAVSFLSKIVIFFVKNETGFSDRIYLTMVYGGGHYLYN